MGSYSREIFSFIHYLTILISIGFFAGSLALYYVEVDDFVSIRYVSEEIFLVCVGLSAFSFLVSLAAVVALRRRNGCLFLCYLCIVPLLAGFFAATAAFILTDKFSIGKLDETLSDASTIELVVEDAYKNPDGFRKTQETLDCCGINIENSFLENATEFQLTGTECTTIDADTTLTGTTEITNILSLYPEFNQTVQELADGNPLLGSNGFFCADVVIDQIDALLLYTAIALSVLAFFELVSFICAIVILCKVPADSGGLSKKNSTRSMNSELQFQRTGVPADWKKEKHAPANPFLRPLSYVRGAKKAGQPYISPPAGIAANYSGSNLSGVSSDDSKYGFVPRVTAADSSDDLPPAFDSATYLEPPPLPEDDIEQPSPGAYNSTGSRVPPIPPPRPGRISLTRMVSNVGSVVSRLSSDVSDRLSFGGVFDADGDFNEDEKPNF